MKKLYAIAMCAQLGTRILIGTGACVRTSKEEAIGAAMLMALDKYPVEIGYTGHGVVVEELSVEMVEFSLDEQGE